MVGDAGVLVDPRSAEQIRSRLLELIENRELRETLSQKARHHITQFQWGTIAQKYLDLYASVQK